MTAKAPPRITPSYIENAALHYLERFASSRANLRRVLMRKVDRSLAHWGGEREQAAAMVDAVMAKLAGLGYVDDARFAEMKAASLHRRGTSARMIRARLAAKGVDAEATAAGLAAIDTDEPDLAAAVNLARRRRLGPFRPPETRADFRDKDAATLARAGFSWDVVRQVIEAEDGEALLD
ncbi:MAG: regulatory protein RecX [Actinomycetota bacterium]